MEEHGKYGLKSNETLIGIIFILIGVYFLTDKLKFLNILWQSAVIIWGILLLREKNVFQGLIVTAFGIVLLGDTLFTWHITDVLIGIGFLAIGIKTIFSNLR